MTNQVTFTPDTLTNIAALATSFCKLDADRSLSLHKFMGLVGDSPTYENWMQARTAWIQGYLVVKPAANEDAQNMAWSRYLAALRTYASENGFDFTVPNKPKASTPAAEKAREKRANEFADMGKADLVEAVASIHEAIKCAPPQETGMHAAKLVKAQEALSKIEKVERKAADTAKNKDKNNRVDAVAKAAKVAGPDVLVLLEAVIDATDDNAPDDIRARAWEMLASVSLGALNLKMPKRK